LKPQGLPTPLAQDTTNQPRSSGKKKAAVGAVVATGGVGALLAKVSGGFKALGLIFAGLFSHGAADDAASLALRTTHEISAVSTFTKPVVQTLIRIPGQEAEQLQSLVGEQRDRFLLLVAREEIRAMGLKLYVRGPFRSWVAETALACERRGILGGRECLEEALTLGNSSRQWKILENEILTSLP